MRRSGGGAAVATIHPIESGECAAPPANGSAGDTQNPPGISTPGGGNFLQPLIATGLLDPDTHEPTGELPAALHGDSGDEHCAWPGTTDHSDDFDPGSPPDNEADDANFPGRGKGGPLA